MSRTCMLVVISNPVREKEESIVALRTHLAFKKTLWVGAGDQDANPVPISPLADDLATVPSGLVIIGDILRKKMF